MRILVLWNPCRGVPPGEDAGWARSQIARLEQADGIAALALHPVIPAAPRSQPPIGWCLELRVAEGRKPGEVVRDRPCAELISDLTLLGMHPRVLAIEGEL